MRVLAYIISFCLLIGGCRGGEPVTITELDYQIFAVHKTSNKNYVVYSAKTDGACGIEDVWAYWVMDEEDGHTEDLLDIEQDYYGVTGFSKDGTTASFRVAALDDRIVAAHVKIEKDAEGNTSCYFEGFTTIDSVHSKIDYLLIDNEGFDVHWIDVIGERISAPFGEVKERIIPPD